MINEIALAMAQNKVNNMPLEIKHVVISPAKWQEIRPIIKLLQAAGLWYDVSSYYNKIYLRVRVNPYTQTYIESLL